ncbi:MAG: branched-chain amino acid ABC transporter permease [Pseudomonadota bacterium]
MPLDIKVSQYLMQGITGFDKGAAYALIALGLTLVFGTLGVVNFAHGALFMLGAFVTITVVKMMGLSILVAVIVCIPILFAVGVLMERLLIRYFYDKPHVNQIMVTFGLAIVVQEVVKIFYGANPHPVPFPDWAAGRIQIGSWLPYIADWVSYPMWRLFFIICALVIIGIIFSWLHFTKFGMVVRAGMRDPETCRLLGIDISRYFTAVFGVAAVVAGLAGVLYAPVVPSGPSLGMDYLVLSFLVVVVGGMGSLGGAVAAGFLLGLAEAFASLPDVTQIIRALDQIILFLVAVIVLLVRPRGLFGKKGIME